MNNEAFVTIDGEYGVGVLTFPESALSDGQWDTMITLHSSDRFDYVKSILSNNESEIKRIEAGL